MRRTEIVKPADIGHLPFSKHYFNPNELGMLVTLVNSVRAQTMVEFGVNEGRCAATLLKHCPMLTRYVGLDVHRGYQTIKEVQRGEVPLEPGKYAEHDPRFELILRTRGSFELSATDLPICEAVFIDADHSRAGVLNDYALAKQIVSPGGIIIFHDDNNLNHLVDVTPTLDELHEGGADIVHVADSWLAYERVR